jgi:hypothetical protein
VNASQDRSGQTRSFGDVDSMSGLPDSGHDWAIYEHSRHSELVAAVLAAVSQRRPRTAITAMAALRQMRCWCRYRRDDGLIAVAAKLCQ